MMLHSPGPGAGKTTLACAVVNHLITKYEGRFGVVYETGPGLGVRVRGTYQDKSGESEAALHKLLAEIPLLVLDDIGDRLKEAPTEHTQRVYFAIVDARYRAGLPILVVTNSIGDELASMIGAYTFDRLMEMCGGAVTVMRGPTRLERLK